MAGRVGGSGRRGVQSVSGRISGARELDAGARAFYEVSKRLKEVGGTGKGSLRNEMQKAVKKAAKPLPQAVKDEARKRLPKKGGLNEIIAKRTPKVVTRTGATTAGVQIQDKRTDPRLSTQGRMPHPIFGRKGSDYVQLIPQAKGYFDEPQAAAAPQVRDEVAGVLVDFMERIARK